MAQDFLSVITPNEDLTVADFDGGHGPGEASTNFATGDLRRKYNFGDRVSEVAIAQDPFFRFLSKVAKKPVDDPQFKWVEKRPSFHKRYAYPIAFSNDSSTWVETLDGTDITTQLDTYESSSSTVYVKMAGDYDNRGNIQNVYGNSSGNNITIGADNTTPKFYLPGQLIKINFAAAAGGSVGSYALCRIDEGGVSEQTGSSSYDSESTADAMVLKCTVIKTKDAGDDYIAGTSSAALAADTVSTSSIAGSLELTRSYVVGTAFKEGSGYPETWKDQPYSTNIGQTQIWKTSMAMTNTARATSLKYDSNEWARIWKEKLIEHKWDLETSLLFGSQSSGQIAGVAYTQGAVDYITQYGNQFSLTIATKTADDFLDDMSNLLDPRYNQATSTLFFCNTAVYNWMHKLGGYFKNNLEISSNFRADLALTGKKKVFGVDISTFSTPYGDMNVARNIHLDGTPVKMLGINMKNCAWRPLVGNGINRDTSVYVGVQTLENSGVDRRVDLILTEGGMEWQLAESHAIWT